MKKFSYIVRVYFFLMVSVFFFESSKGIILAKSFENHTVIAKKSKKKVSRETIYSKKALIKSLEKHLTKMDQKFSYKINKKIVKNLSEFEKIFGNTKNKKFLPAAIISQVDYLDYHSSSTRQFFQLDLNIKYKLSRKQLKKFATEMKELEKAQPLNIENEVREDFFKKLLNLETNYSVKMSKHFSRIYKHDIDNFFVSLEDDPRFNDLRLHMQIYGEIKDYSSFSLLNFSIKHLKSKNELKEIIRNISPVLMTRQEVIDAMIKKEEGLMENFSVNISSSLGDFEDDKVLDDFWDELNERPEYNDIVRYNKDGRYNVYPFKGYYKLSKNNQYTLQNEELERLRTFVLEWVKTNIREEMTEEEKVRAINDYMVSEYRYTYGDKGKFSGEGIGEEKLGRYSVYSSFALIEEKGGVCNAKANLFYRLAKETGLESLYISGTGNGELHAWNMVKVDGNWYHIDNTWNRGQYEGNSEYEYFNTRDYYLKGDETMRKDHTWDASKYPAAPLDYPGYVPTVGLENRTIFDKAA